MILNYMYLVSDGVYMTCDFKDANRTAIITTTYSNLTAEVYVLLQIGRITFGRRADISYVSETAVQALFKSEDVCQEGFDLLCIDKNYKDHQGNYAVACRCKRFVRQIVNSFVSSDQTPSKTRDFSRAYSGKRYNTSIQ